MISAPAVKSADEVAVGMGQSVLAHAPARLTTILGSCVAVTLYSPRRRLGMLSHVVLPQSKGGASNPAKFADTAVPHMVLDAQEPGHRKQGGHGQAGRRGPDVRQRRRAQIGESNVRAVVQALEAAGIRIAGRDVRRHQRPPDLFRPGYRLHCRDVRGSSLPIHLNEGSNYYGKDSGCDRRRRDYPRESQGSGPHAGWEIAGEARNGKEAVERYTALRPTAMTVDLVMPEYDGLYAVREIMTLDPDAKIIVISAIGQKNVLREAFKLGVTDFIVKPFDKRALAKTLEAARAR